MRPRQETTVGTDLHLPCACGHTWSAHLPLAGSTVGRCTVDCLDRCGEYIASAPRQVEAKPARNSTLDTALTRADHARAEFCCWCSRDEACRLLALCDALDAAQAERDHWKSAYDRTLESYGVIYDEAVRDRHARADAVALGGQVQAALARRASERDQARAALARVEALHLTPYDLEPRDDERVAVYADGYAVAMVRVRAAIAGDPPAVVCSCGYPFTDRPGSYCGATAHWNTYRVRGAGGPAPAAHAYTHGALCCGMPAEDPIHQVAAVQPAAPTTEMHKPFTDDGVTYCGWDRHEGCGEVWPCSTERARLAAGEGATP